MYIESRFERDDEFWTVEKDNKQWKIVGPWKIISVNFNVSEKETTIRYTTNIKADLGLVQMFENDKMFRSLWEAYNHVDKTNEQIKESEAKMNFENSAETASEEEMLA